jgi:peptidoglycan/LPS O-acetylase OafA/YrhL
MQINKAQDSRIPQLDGIRGAAILLVILWHYIVLPSDSLAKNWAAIFSRVGLLTWSGVDLFFVLSGFLIGGILVDAKDSSSYFKPFYVRRAFRILPIYLLLVLGYELLWRLTPHSSFLAQTLGTPMPLFISLTFLQNFWLARHSWNNVFLTLTWSLAVEEQFYLLLPAIVRFVPRRRLPLLAIVMALLVATIRSLLYLRYGSSWGVAAYTLIYCRADALMLGVFCALLWREPTVRQLLALRPWLLRSAVIFFSGGCAVLWFKRWGMGSLPMCTLGFTCIALFYSSLLLSALVNQQGIWARLFRLKALGFIGTIAYGMYLYHVLVLSAVFQIFRRGRASLSSPLDWLAVAFSFVITLSLSFLSWKYFESFLVEIGHRFTYGTKSARGQRGARAIAVS